MTDLGERVEGDQGEFRIGIGGESVDGIGEGRPSDVPGVLCNAVCDALSPFGIEITELPLRPNMIWRKIQEAKAKQAAD